MNPESIIGYGGIVLACALVFCSIGLFFCFFLPTGGILFVIGLLAAKGTLQHPLPIACLLLTASSVVGSIAGYAIGRSTGPFFYSRTESRFFRRSYLTSTEIFFRKYGSIAIAGGYFLPVVRTFAPVLAGIIKTSVQRFLLLSLAGSVLFVGAFVMLGYLMGSLPFLQPWLKYIIAFFVTAVTVPLIVRIVKMMRKPKQL